MARQRNHNEWFRPVSLNNRKSCPNCKAKLGFGEWVWSWGEYIYAKFNRVQYVCKQCWPEVRDKLNSHTDGCGCKVTLVVMGAPQPNWMTLDDNLQTCSANEAATVVG